MSLLKTVSIVHTLMKFVWMFVGVADVVVSDDDDSVFHTVRLAAIRHTMYAVY